MEEQEEKKLEVIPEDKKINKLGRILREIAEWILCFVIAYILYLTLNYFIGTISGVKQVSMKNTAVEGDRLIIQRPTIFKHELKHGDIITFEAPNAESSVSDESDDNIANYVDYEGFNQFLYKFVGIGQMSYIKRVIGLPGDHIVISDTGDVYRNDEKLEEPYLKDGTTSKNGKYTDLVVPEGTVFAMGDNRLESSDCRVFGCIPISRVNGYVIARVWPFNKIGKLQ